jgi:Kef-type K+ transport system membrane component KefB
VPIFFVVLGMLVNIQAMMSALQFGLVITFFAIISKVFGCGIPALAVGFNQRGAWRVGFGMLPRGEVALIVAGTGLAAGIIDQTIFGVSILMTIVTTLIAPMALVPLFQSGGSGRRDGGEAAPAEAN